MTLWGEAPAGRDPDTLASVVAGNAMRLYRAARGMVAPLHREVFVLRQVERPPARDVSSILHVTVTHIGVLLHRARTRLRLCLDLKGWSLSA